MARFDTFGGEIGVVAGSATPDTPTANAGAVTRDTSNQRTGTGCLKFDTAAGNAAATVTTSLTGASSANRSLFIRQYVRFPALPGATANILTYGSAFSARVTSGGKLQFFNDNAATQIGSDSAATIATGTYYRVEMQITVNAGNTAVSAGELRLDGTTVASTTGLALAYSQNFIIGWNSHLPGANTLMYIDDVGVNDSGGAANNTWPGDGKVILMCPISDNARGAWTAGAGGTTNLFAAVDNTPPVGVAQASATDSSQIKNLTTTNPTSYDGNLATYSAAGIGASDTINSIIVWDADGEDPATGTKTGACSMVSNPAIAEPTAFNFGNDSGAQGTYLNLWTWHSTAVSQAPSVTISSAPVIRMRCISGATAARAASCCFLGAYVDYTPAVPTRDTFANPTNFMDPGIF